MSPYSRKGHEGLIGLCVLWCEQANSFHGQCCLFLNPNILCVYWMFEHTYHFHQKGESQPFVSWSLCMKVTFIHHYCVLSLTKSVMLFCWCLVMLYPVSLLTVCVVKYFHYLGNNIENQPIATQNASRCRQECTNNDKCQYFKFNWNETEIRLEIWKEVVLVSPWPWHVLCCFHQLNLHYSAIKQYVLPIFYNQ